jgi:hypothetical protein
MHCRVQAPRLTMQRSLRKEIVMRFMDVTRALTALALIGVAAPAAAVNCYMIVDRSNEVIYQDITSPVDLSDQGSAERDALRRRGQQLVALDAERCPAIDRARIAGKGGPATVDEIVAGMRPAASFGTGATPASTAPDAAGGIALPRITVPRDTGGGMSVGGPPSGMSIR